MRDFTGIELKAFVKESLESATPSAAFVIKTIYAEVQRLEHENAVLTDGLNVAGHMVGEIEKKLARLKNRGSL